MIARRRKIKAAQTFVQTPMCTVAGARALADRLDRAATTRISLDRGDLRLAAEVIHALLRGCTAPSEIKLGKDDHSG